MKTIKTTIEDGILGRMLDPLSECLTPVLARRLVNFRADSTTQARIEELATKNDEGDLPPVERREYRAYVRAISFQSFNPRQG